MLHGSSPAVALLLTIVAVLAAVGAVLFVRWSARLRATLIKQQEAVEHAHVRAGRSAGEFRATLDRSAVAMTASRTRMEHQEQEIRGWTRTLVSQRASIERVTTGRMARIIRMAHLVTKAAQIAFLWR